MFFFASLNVDGVSTRLDQTSATGEFVTLPLLPRANPRVSEKRLANSRQNSIQVKLKLKVTQPRIEVEIRKSFSLK